MEAATVPAADEQGGELFDGSQFEMPIPKLDGHVSDKLVLSFGGSVQLDRLMNDDLELIERFRLGQHVMLKVEATVSGKGFSHSEKAATDTKAEEEVVTYAVKLRVHSVIVDEDGD